MFILGALRTEENAFWNEIRLGQKRQTGVIFKDLTLKP
jgi:hypothetical protein